MSDKLELFIIKRKAFANCKKFFHKRDTVLYKMFCVTCIQVERTHRTCFGWEGGLGATVRAIPIEN